MKIVVSACLMGESCKYNGLDNYHRELVEACERTGTEVLLVCPEVFGGLPTPRKPSEIVNGEVRTCEGTSVDREFRLGAERALDMCEQAGGPEEIVACILQDRSPSCGAGHIYDGTFSGTLTAGNGVFVDLLLRHGYRVIPASEFDPSMLGWQMKGGGHRVDGRPLYWQAKLFQQMFNGVCPDKTCQNKPVPFW